MDKNVEYFLNKKIEKTIKNLQNNNMDAYFVQDKIELIEKVKELIKENSTISVGGSMTLVESGILDVLRSGKYNFLDREKNCLTKDDIKEIYRKTFSADTFISSTNALTENGELYNVDGNGNRVAAMIYGPSQVIIVAGVNKIVKDLDEAKKRVENFAAPINAKRLNKNTPCIKTGSCAFCNSDDRICSDYVVLGRQNHANKGRIKVIIINKQLGY